MNKLLVLVLALFFFLKTYSQANSTQDTIDNPYWQTMMKDRTVNYYTTKRAFDLYFSNKAKEKGTGYKQFERWAENAQYRINLDGSFKLEDHVINEIKKFKRNNLEARSPKGNWECLGPFNNPMPASMQRGVGRINEIGFHPTDPNTIYAGAPAGGFWKTTDKGLTWNGFSDAIPSFGVSAIAIIPEAVEPIIIVGTGDRDAGDADGLGTYKSVDGGITFTPSNTGMGNVTVNKLIVNPINTSTIIAATETGIFVSYNKGQSWTKQNGDNVMDIKYCPDDTNYVYAASAATFYRSTNGGKNWTVVSSGISTTSKRRLGIAVTKANANIVYLIAVGTDNGMQALYKSSDKGTNFRTMLLGSAYNPLGTSTNGRSAGGQGWYDLAIESSMTDSNTVFIGGVNIFKSVNGGSTFTPVAYWSYSPTIPWVHADIHFLGRNPLNNELFIGSDGGVDYTVNEGQSYNNINSGLAISQFYNLGVTQLSKTNFITGAQDNGTSSGSSSSSWTAELAGDGMECEWSSKNIDIMVGCAQYGAMQRSINGGTNWSSITSSITDQGQWVVPFQLHPRMENIMVTVFKNAWICKTISSPTTPTFSKMTSSIFSDGSAVRFSNVNDSLVYAGWSDGSIKYCANIFATTPTFVAIPNSNFGSGKVNDIETSFSDKKVLYVAKGSKIYKSSDNGAVWKDISGNLPNLTIYTIALDKYSKEGLYVGTQSGVYYKDSTMTSWIMFSNGLSLNPSVRDIEIVLDSNCSKNSIIFAATYGRGLWISNVYSDTVNNFLSAPLDKDNICYGEKLPLNLSGGVSYDISPNSGVNNLGNGSYELSPSSTTNYRILGKNANQECEVKDITLKVLPSPSLSISPASKTIKKSESVTINISGADSYQWSPSTYVTGSTSSASLNVKPDVTTIYTVIGKGSNGCNSQTKSTITVTNNSGINSIQENDYTIFPNPMSDKMNIHSSKSFTTKIFDLQGRLVYSDDILENEKKIDVSKLNYGSYLVENMDNKGTRTVINITIQR